MGDDRFHKHISYGEFSEGKHLQHKPRKRFKDNIKDTLWCVQINAESWESLANECEEWSAHIHKGLEEYETSRISRAELKHVTCKQDVSNIPSNLGHVWICNVCSCVLLSKAGYVNHMKSHNSKSSAPQWAACNFPVHNSSVHACTTCPKACKSAGGLKSAASLKSHLIAHG